MSQDPQTVWVWGGGGVSLLLSAEWAKLSESAVRPKGGKVHLGAALFLGATPENGCGCTDGVCLPLFSGLGIREESCQGPADQLRSSWEQNKTGESL